MDESDGEDDTSITEQLRRASPNSPCNIPMLVVVSFNPDIKGQQKKQIEIQRGKSIVDMHKKWSRSIVARWQGFPVNAQFIVNEWLFVKTADNDEGFVPYICCRPMLRRQSLKHSTIDMEHSYRPYDFDSSRSRRSKSPSTSVATPTSPNNKKLSLSSTLCSQSILLSNNNRRQDVNSSSCGGDSGFSDCESASQRHHRSFDQSIQRSTRSSNVRTLRTLSNPLKKHGLIVQDVPSMKSIKINQSHVNLSKFAHNHPMKSQLSISSNSAFTQFVKKSIDQEQNRWAARIERHTHTVCTRFSSILSWQFIRWHWREISSMKFMNNDMFSSEDASMFDWHDRMSTRVTNAWRCVCTND
jgi:hypothetical protein